METLNILCSSPEPNTTVSIFLDIADSDRACLTFTFSWSWATVRMRYQVYPYNIAQFIDDLEKLAQDGFGMAQLLSFDECLDLRLTMTPDQPGTARLNVKLRAVSDGHGQSDIHPAPAPFGSYTEFVFANAIIENLVQEWIRRLRGFLMWSGFDMRSPWDRDS